MKIAFSGASGTGKSTLARFVSERFNLPMNPIGSRQVAEAMGYASPYDVDAAGRRREFQRRLVAEKVAWESARRGFVTDRTPLDNLAYLSLHDIGAVDDEAYEFAMAGTRRYDLVFYCEREAFQELGDDPARVKTIAYHKVFDSLLDGLIRRIWASHASTSRVWELTFPCCGRPELRQQTVEKAILDHFRI